MKKISLWVAPRRRAQKEIPPLFSHNSIMLIRDARLPLIGNTELEKSSLLGTWNCYLANLARRAHASKETSTVQWTQSVAFALFSSDTIFQHWGVRMRSGCVNIIFLISNGNYHFYWQRKCRPFAFYISSKVKSSFFFVCCELI